MPETAVLSDPCAPFFTPDGKPIGEHLNELPIPEEHRQTIEDHMRQSRYRSTKDQLWFLNHCKLDIYFANRHVLCYKAEDDWVVLVHGVCNEPRFRYILDNLTEEQNRRVTLITPTDWS